jgi:signal transduction histidine kinase
MAERQTALTAHLFSIRREYIKDLLDDCRKHYDELQRATQPLKGVPQARGLFKGLSWLQVISNRLERAHDTSNLTVDPPLFAVSTYLNKAIQNEYTTMATAHHLTIKSTVEGGLAFRITPGDIAQLMNSIVENALTYSRTGGEVEIRGKRRSEKIIITVSDYGSGIDDERMLTLFKPIIPNKYEIAAPALNLHLNKIIMARVGGELRISSQKDKGTIVTIIAHRQRNRDNYKVPVHILRSTGALD